MKHSNLQPLKWNCVYFLGFSLHTVSKIKWSEINFGWFYLIIYYYQQGNSIFQFYLNEPDSNGALHIRFKKLKNIFQLESLAFAFDLNTSLAVLFLFMV